MSSDSPLPSRSKLLSLNYKRMLLYFTLPEEVLATASYEQLLTFWLFTQEIFNSKEYPQ